MLHWTVLLNYFAEFKMMAFKKLILRAFLMQAPQFMQIFLGTPDPLEKCTLSVEENTNAFLQRRLYFSSPC